MIICLFNCEIIAMTKLMNQRLAITDDFIRRARQQNFLPASTCLIHWDKTTGTEKNLSLGDDRIWCRQDYS